VQSPARRTVASGRPSAAATTAHAHTTLGLKRDSTGENTAPAVNERHGIIDGLDDTDTSTGNSTLIEQEEAILHTHMSNIKKNADLLTREGELLSTVMAPNRTMDDVERYATALEEVLVQKEDMILGLRRQMSAFKSLSRRDQL
jgi:hypothetical protein